MEIFDFTGGKKGKLLGEREFQSLGGHGGNLNLDYKKYEYQMSGTTDGERWIAQTFGVEAICYCTGKWRADEGDFEWNWCYTSYPEYAEKLCKGNTSEFTEILDALFDDDAFRYSIDHNDVVNMQMVLRANGYKHTFDYATEVIVAVNNELGGSQTNTSRWNG